MRRVLAISPHLDDAVLSAGGRLFELASEGVEVTVFTVFAGRPMPPFSPVAAYLHGLWGLGDAPVVHRQAEDRRAVSLLGAAERHGSFLDAVYRRTTDGEAWLIGMDGVPPEGEHEPELAARLADAITDLVGELRPDTVLTCAAIGVIWITGAPGTRSWPLPPRAYRSCAGRTCRTGTAPRRFPPCPRGSASPAASPKPPRTRRGRRSTGP